jgi:long-chain acyl-CoA synthetase
MPSQSPLSKHVIERLVLDLLADELALSRGRSAMELGANLWSIDTRIDDRGLALDSMERLNASSALNAFFHLHEYGAEDYLLAMPTIGEWVDLVAQSLAETGTYLTFQTSGSTGAPKSCTHAISDLMREAACWADIVDSPERIVSLVPSHHIYGTIWSALLPDLLGIACDYRRFSAAKALANAPDDKILVIGTPTLWQYLSRSLPKLPAGMTGISSTAPLPVALAEQLRAQQIGRLIEVYGSSETAGIGWRADHREPYALLNHWARHGKAEIIRTNDQTAIFTLMDDVEWQGDRHLSVKGRSDGAVQVGGHNVFPEQVRIRLLSHPEIGDAAVRFDPVSSRLKAFIVPVKGTTETNTLVDRVDTWGGTQFKAAERPRQFTVGDAIPRNAMGKLADW